MGNFREHLWGVQPSAINDPTTLAQSVKQQLIQREQNEGLFGVTADVSCIATQTQGQFICQVTTGQNGVETGQQNVNVTVSPDGSSWATSP